MDAFIYALETDTAELDLVFTDVAAQDADPAQGEAEVLQAA